MVEAAFRNAVSQCVKLRLGIESCFDALGHFLVEKRFHKSAFQTEKPCQKKGGVFGRKVLSGQAPVRFSVKKWFHSVR